ncbi:MAG TPA: SgcJ/EcaC family oxidoreductase [Thermoanaerobaculia bacterium]
MLRLLAVFTVFTALAACATGQPSTQEAQRAVEQASDQFIEARQSGDAASFAALFTEEGIYMVPGLLDATGRTAVRELAEKRFAAGPSKDFKVNRRETDVVGDSAYELTWFSETGSHHHMQGRHFILWKRGDDEMWRVHRYHYNFSDATPIE